MKPRKFAVYYKIGGRHATFNAFSLYEAVVKATEHALEMHEDHLIELVHDIEKDELFKEIDLTMYYTQFKP